MTMLRVLVAMLIGAAVAVAVVALVAAAFLSGDNKPWEIALHFTIFGTVIVFPIAVIGGIPLYYLFRWRGWLTPRTVIAGGTALALTYPFFVWWESKPDTVSFLEFLVCAVAGVVASLVFIRISKVGHAERHL